MGCISSKIDINDRHPNIFQVTNVNEHGKKIKAGKLQVTDTALVFYQRGKKPTKWPLRSLRKYGFDTETFSFECGRRCPTGHGIYAFKCKKAEMLFNVVQHHITGNVTDDNTEDFHASNGQVLVSRRPPSTASFQVQTDGYLNPVSIPSVPESNSAGANNSPLSPTSGTSQVEIPAEHNNNKRDSVVPEPSYPNVVVENGIMPQYSNSVAGELVVGEGFSTSHVYMNVDMPQPVSDIQESHCYANINSEDVEELRPVDSVPFTPLMSYANLDHSVIDEVNYAELDLDGSQTSNVKNITQVVQEMPTIKEKYVTIDFQKTFALSKSKDPSIAIEEGSRKTRHNSTINYNSSISD